MAPANEFFARALPPALSGAPSRLFSELREFLDFLIEELKPFPGRGHAVARLVVAVAATVIICQTLRIPEPAYSAYIIFFIANDDGVSSLKLGLLAMVGTTLGIATALGITICFMDAPWFRLPVTFIVIGGAIWLSRVMVLAPLGRLLAVILVLYLSLADTIFNPETLTEATLWLWSVVGVAVGISVLTNFLLEPRPDLLLRAQIATALESTRQLLEKPLEEPADRWVRAKALRRQLYGSPPRMRSLLARWKQRRWPDRYDTVDWELGIYIVERLLSSAAALALADNAVNDGTTCLVKTQLGEALAQLRQAVENSNPEAIRSLILPSTDDLPDFPGKPALAELAAALSDCRSVLLPYARPGEPDSGGKPGSSKSGFLIPDALTNPEYVRFVGKTTLAIVACEIFLNAVNWPGIRTCMITCAVTALATVGAQRQKQLLRLTGVFVGGLMGLVSILYIVPQLDTITGLLLLVAAGTACCAWVAAGSTRSSYAGFQMALAFFIMLLSGFMTSIDLTGIRDRFVGILVGITAMWIFFDHLWHTSSRRQLVDKLVAILRLMAQAPQIVAAGQTPEEARQQASRFRGNLTHELDRARLYLDETKIELTLAINPKAVRGDELEAMATEVSFAAFQLLALNEHKLRAILAGQLSSAERLLQPADSALARGFADLAAGFDAIHQSFPASLNQPSLRAGLPRPAVDFALPEEIAAVNLDLRPIYQSLENSIQRISRLDWIVRALP
ncbi:MAG TPA: FUSC family protein [Candidatus Methylacidiphilales bacterium]|nr:FUSC family protein [Candidatus Methylacidiphilales bacterium]